MSNNQLEYNDSDKAINPFTESFEDRVSAAEKTINEDTEYLIFEEEVKRSELPDSAFGLPEDRKYPLDTEQHVRSAIRLFGHCPDAKKKALAKRISRKAAQYNIEVPETTQVYKYAHEAVIVPKELVFTDRYITEEEITANDMYELSLLESEEEVQDNVKSAGKPDALSRSAVVSALEKAASIPDEKKKSAEIRKVISSTVGKLSAKIKYTFGNLKLYNKEYSYDGYIKEVFPKYIEMLNAKDLYKLKESIMEHAFTTGRGHKSLSDVINSNQNSTDKENYVLNLADRVRRDLSSVLHTIDRLYEKSRFDGVKPYNPKKETPKEEPKVEEKKEEDEEEDNPIKEKPKKRKSYWDVDVSEEDEEEAENESANVEYRPKIEYFSEGFKLPGKIRSEVVDNLDKIKAKSGVVISKDRAKTESETANYDFKSKGLIPVAFMGDNDYIAYNVAKKKWCKVNTVDGIIFKYSDKLIHTLESADILEEKAKIRSDEPDDAGYYESNIKFRGARVVVCSRYSEEAESIIKSIQKAFKNVEKSYTNILESVAEEIYAEWSRDHGEIVPKEEFTRSIFKSKLQNRIIAMQDQYGYIFEFNYSVNMKVGGTGRLVVNIFTDLDGFVTSYRYSTEATVRKY